MASMVLPFSYKPDPGANGAIIKVIGVGGGGCNTVNRMSREQVGGVDYIAANTDRKSLNSNVAVTKIVLGESLTGGLGAGSDPATGRQAAELSADQIEDALRNTHLLFIASGFGGGTGTGASPVVAQIAQKLNILTVAVVTTPFEYEQRVRMKRALKGIEELRQYVDTLIVIPNQRLLALFPTMTMRDGFDIVDSVVIDATRGISDLVSQSGEINTDFADVKRALQNGGQALFGFGKGSGKDRAVQAAEEAIKCELYDNPTYSGATHALVSLTVSTDVTLAEADIAMKTINQVFGEEVEFKMGLKYDEDASDLIKLTLIATGFQSPGGSPDIGTPAQEKSGNQDLEKPELPEGVDPDRGGEVDYEQTVQASTEADDPATEEPEPVVEPEPEKEEVKMESEEVVAPEPEPEPVPTTEPNPPVQEEPTAPPKKPSFFDYFGVQPSIRTQSDGAQKPNPSTDIERPTYERWSKGQK